MKRDINLRRCVSCRREAPKSDFWRVVRVYPAKTVELDRGAGRSAYICPAAACLKLARQKNRLGRALKVNIPERIFTILEGRLNDRK